MSLCIFTERDFKEWAHVTVEAGESEVCRAGRLEARGELMLQLEAEGGLLRNSLSPGGHSLMSPKAFS